MAPDVREPVCAPLHDNAPRTLVDVQDTAAGDQPRLFTLAEANALLPRVRDLIQTLHAKGARLEALQEQLASFRRLKQQGDHEAPRESRVVKETLGEVDNIAAAIHGVLVDLHQTGCELKDARMGLVDFHSVREERVVYLCWRLGEDTIRFWHELDTGFSGRQPL